MKSRPLHLAVLLLPLFLVAPASSQTSNAAEPARTAPGIRAVVVGISRYPKLPGGQQLQFADRDASFFAELLQTTGVPRERVRVLIGAEATTAAIKSAIGNWLAQAVESDTVILFFSGHGFFEDQFGEAYLLGADSDSKDPYSTALSVSDIEQALKKRVRAGKVLVIADAMRRDFFDPDSNPQAAASFTRAFSDLAAARNGSVAILANSPGEYSREGQRWGGHGAFTRHLVDLAYSGVCKNAEDWFNRISPLLSQDSSGRQHVWKSGGPLERIEFPSLPNSRGQLASATRQDLPSSNTTTAPSEKPDSPVKSRTTRAAPNTRRPKREAQPSKPVDSPVPAERRDGEVSSPAARNTETPPSSSVSDRNSAADAAAPRTTSSGRGTNSKAQTKEPPADTARSTAPPPNPPSAAVSSPEPAPVSARSDLPSSATLPTEPSRPARASSTPPAVSSVSEAPARTQPAPPAIAVPESTTSSAAAPSPLIFKVEEAIAANRLVDPPGSSAWDLYQRLTVDPGSAAEVSRLRPKLSEALVKAGRDAVVADVRSDNIADRVDDFKRAGRMLSRARQIGATGDIAALEKLSAAEALIALQFYDEAEQALAQLQNAKIAAIDNALGLTYLGRLENVRAERAFKRSIEMDPKYAAPHYNLALLYRAGQNESAMSELSQAAELDPSNAAILETLGDEYFARQKWSESAESFRKAIQIKPNDDNLHTKLGHALFSAGLTEEANREYKRAAELRKK